MTTITFDTHAFAKRLVAAGMPEAQAEAVTNVVKEARETDLDSLAAKVDLQLMERDLKIWFGKMMAWQLSAISAMLAIATAAVKLL